MKKQPTFLSILLMFAITQTFGQVPQAFKYQAIVRNNSGNIIANTKVSFRMSLLQGSTSGSVSYEETDTATTNQFGLANLSIGMGTVVSGIMDTINWGKSSYYIKVEFDPTGGSNFTLMGTSQMLAVPYALYSQSTGDTSMWRKNGTNIYWNANQPVNGGIGIGTKSPANLLHLQDTIGTGGISAIIEGRVLTGVYLRTHDTLNRPYKSWVMQNETFSGYPVTGNAFSLYFSNGYSFSSYPFSVQGSSPTNSMVITPTGVGIGTNAPAAKLHVDNGDAYIDNSSNGVIVKSPNGNCWRIQVNNSGTITATSITCP